MVDLVDDGLVKIEKEDEEPEQKPEIVDFFDGTSVFITGATGFLGRLVLEKLLRACKGIKKIYILIREKKGKNVNQRYEELFNVPIYDGLKREDPNFLDKVILMEGDCVLPNLGLSEENQKIILNEVHCVFHCAAIVRFDAKLRMYAYINVRSTRDLLLLAKNMKNLKSFIYISTAYSFCVHKEIKEEFYEPDITGDGFLNFVELLEDDTLGKMAPMVRGSWPNPYVFSKSITEDVVRTYGKGLPVAIIRPSIVISTAKEPLAGWIDNIYGATGVFVGAALGIIRTLHCNSACLADMVPADYIINCTIAAAWYTGKQRQLDLDKKESEPVIYNYIMSNQNPITWGEVQNYVHKSLVKVPSTLQIWHYCFKLNSYYWVHYLFLIFLHRIPAYIVDSGARCLGKTPTMVEGYKKMEKFLDVISYFSTQEWKFHNDNTQQLWKKLNKKDQNLFDFDLDAFEWVPYFDTCGKGGRVYLIKDPLDTLPQGRVKYNKLMVAHYTLVTILLLGFAKLLMMLWNAIF